MNTAFDPAAEGWTLLEGDGFIGLVGPFWRRDGVAREYGFLARPDHRNLVHVVHGGMIMTFADRALGLEAWRAAGDRPAVTIQFTTSFLATGRIGSFVTLAPRVMRTTRSLVFLDGTVLADGAAIATAQGIWKIRTGPGPG